MANSLTTAGTLTGRTVLVAIFSFFAVVLVVNSVFLALAISTNSGVVANEPYRNGLKYNERIEADQQQKALEWTSDVTFADGDRRLVARLSDRDGKAISGLLAMAKVGRAATNREDVEAQLNETEPGRYEAKLPIISAGGYIVNLDISDPSTADHGVIYRARRRLWLKP